MNTSVRYMPSTHQKPTVLTPRPPVHHASTKHSAIVSLDPNNLFPHDIRTKLTSLLVEYDLIFDPTSKATMAPV